MAYNKKDCFNESQLIIEAKATLDRIITWINYCDQKTGIVLGALGVVFSVILSLDCLSKYKVIITSLINTKHIILLILMSVGLFLIIIGIFFLISTLIPIINSSIYKEKFLNTHSKIFFNTIANKNSYDEYRRDYLCFRKQDYLNDLISQIYINSKIASKKYHLYKRGITISLIGGIIFIITTLISLFVI